MTEFTDEREEAVQGRSAIWDVAWLGAGVLGAFVMVLLVGGLTWLVGIAGAGMGMDAGAGFGVIMLMGFSLIQLIWIAPLAGVAIWFRRTRFAGYGLIIGALLIFLLQASCYGLALFFLASLGN